MSSFPATHLRRLRRTGALRDLVRETELRAGQLVLPLFIAEAGAGGPSTRESLVTLPGVERRSISAKALKRLRI